MLCPHIIGRMRLLELADMLETADEYHKLRNEPPYDQSQYFHTCGSPSCALGEWAAAHADRWHLVASIPLLRGYTEGPGSAAMMEFSITYPQFLCLFQGDGCAGATTAQEAAKFIRDWVAAGN